MRKIMFILVALVLLVTACLPAQNTQELEARVNTAVAETMAVENQIANSVEQTVVALEPLASPTAETVDAALTFTEAPTSTATPFSIDTFTPFPVNPTATRVYVQAKYSCTVINRRPFDLSEYNPGDKFDIKWTIVNTGSKSWDAGVDVKYSSGPKMAGVNRVEIPKIMNPNDSYTIVMDGVAPNKKGRQVETFVVDGPMCFPYVAIVVK
jgi:Ig-like domain from next to BRCA1 gene